MEPNEQPEEIVAKDQGTDANPWPHPRPDYMTETHNIILKELWKEGLTPTPMIEEMCKLFPEFKPHEIRRIVMHWMWCDNFRMRQ